MSDPRDGGKEKKERVIHTRIPESLDEELRERANRLGVSVSNLVRNALSHAFGLVEDIISDGASVARSARGPLTEPGPAPPLPEAPDAAGGEATAAPVLLWQRVILNTERRCARCDKTLRRGWEAALALCEDGSQRVVCIDDMNEELAR